ncbi:hypothetical protein FQR65_LT01317 [Abscondita terminalis]|nr:hypothetical protein FQR65_LT01317 [Abscondita terminalis]
MFLTQPYSTTSIKKCVTETQSETDLDKCKNIPFFDDKTCHNLVNFFNLICIIEDAGRNYQEKLDPDLDLQKQQCVKNECSSKKKNFRCDEECNTYSCDFDGYDCSLGINPWSNCAASCSELFMNGRCDYECYNADCLYDGYDCESPVSTCNPLYEAYCQEHYANGICDYGCNTAECSWDGLDCDNTYHPEMVDGVVIAILLMDVEEFKQNLVKFLRDTSYELRTTVRVKKDDSGKNMIYNWTNSHQVFDKYGNSGVEVYLEIDSSKCTYCYESAHMAARFLAAKASRNKLSKKFPFYQVTADALPKVCLQNTLLSTLLCMYV